MFRSRQQNGGRKYNTKIANKSFENEAKSKYLETGVINKNYIHEEIRAGVAQSV
jgi:hypothetical protein